MVSKNSVTRETVLKVITIEKLLDDLVARYAEFPRTDFESHEKKGPKKISF